MSGAATIACATLWDVLREPALETLARAKDAGTLPLDVEEKLQQLILDASADLEASCGRWFKLGTWTETFDVRTYPPATLRLHACPVTAITSVVYSSDRDFANGTTLAATDYVLRRGGRHGELVLLDSVATGIGVVQVTYTGGLADAVARLPADLRQACVEQVAFAWKRNVNIDLESISQDQGSVTYFRDGAGTAGFSRALFRYRVTVVS